MRLHAHKNCPIGSLPTIASQSFIHQDLQILAVIYDFTNSPNTDFYPHFRQHSHFEILALQQDFLWEKSCYELFVAFDNAKNSPYIEINFSPEGYFNLYHFDSYRTPLQLPPRRLNLDRKQQQQLLNVYHKSGEMPAVFWQASLPKQQSMQKLMEKRFPLDIDNSRLVIIIDLTLLAELLRIKMTGKIWFNLCAVFKGEQEMVYFAHQHASPPDFHNKKYWLKLTI